MAKITASLFMALDGVVDPMIGNWHFPYFNEEMGEAVAETKQIAISGCVSIVRQLLDAGQLDELHLFVHPATAGTGLRLFGDDRPALTLKLESAQPFKTGVVHLVYAPDPNPPTGSYAEARGQLPDE